MSLGAGALRQLINLGWAVSSWEWSRGGVNGAQCDEFILVSTFLVPDNTGTNYLTWGETKHSRRIIIPCDFLEHFIFRLKNIFFLFYRRGNIIIICSPDNDPNDVKSQQAWPQSPAGRGLSLMWSLTRARHPTVENTWIIPIITQQCFLWSNN